LLVVVACWNLVATACLLFLSRCWWTVFVKVSFVGFVLWMVFRCGGIYLLPLFHCVVD
ncbi:unnamed protein product, partial [Brassica napus]